MQVEVITRRAETTPAERAEAVVQPTDRIARLHGWVPYLLALLFVARALQHAGQGVITDTDAARHAMNGAFLYDLVRLGHVKHPIEYAKEYYAHLPALSMPFHPPGFPAMEAISFAIFGVSVLSARLVVALSVGVCVLLLYRLIKTTLGNDVIAACATVTVLSIWNCQFLATETMLEFPALAFTLAALLCLRQMDRAYTMRSALLFAGFATAAVWTKQQTCFLLAVPLLFAILSRRWRLLRQKPFWISWVIVAAATAGVVFIWANFRGLSTPDANNVGTTPDALRSIFVRNLYVYRDWFVDNYLWIAPVFAFCVVLVYAWAALKGQRLKLGASLYVAWILSVVGLLMVLGAATGRYLFWVFPAVAAVLYAILFRASAYLWGERRACLLLFGFALTWFMNGLRFQPEFLHGPAEAAALITRDQAPARVLYAGEADGNFIFAVRTHDSKLQTTVIRGEKLPPEFFVPAAFEQFCRDYGINWIVLEEVPLAHKWSALARSTPATMRMETSISLVSNRPRWQAGTIRIYRFTAPSDHPRSVLTVPVRKMGHSIEIKF